MGWTPPKKGIKMIPLHVRLKHKETSMNEYKIIGIELANKVFQVAALNQASKVVFNKKVSRKKLMQTIAQLPPSIIAMEACGSANYWRVNTQIWDTRSD
jgi:hypothetical protein